MKTVPTAMSVTRKGEKATSKCLSILQLVRDSGIRGRFFILDKENMEPGALLTKLTDYRSQPALAGLMKP